MQNFSNRHINTLAVHSHANAFACHGDLGLDADAFSTHIHSIIVKRLGADPLPSAAFGLARSLHLNDLYLTLACSQGSAVAWVRLVSLYTESIRKLCKCACPSNDAARELADSLPGQLFLPGATGRPRISSYGGLSPLASWLGVVVRRLAEKKRHLKSNNLESIEQVPDVADLASVFRIESALRAGRYAALITDSLQVAVGLLSDRERVILHLRYEQQMQVRELAQLFGVKPPAITKQISRTRQKLREKVASILADRHRLGPASIEECIASILENPEQTAPALT